MARAPCEVYAEQLFQCKLGLPLWNPQPTKYGEVLVGDVGFLDEGGFYRMFNATRLANDELNRYGVPAEYVPFLVDEYGLHVEDNSIRPGTLRSKSIIKSSLHGKAKLGGQAGGVGAEVGFKFECKDETGALLVLKDAATKTILRRSARMPDYMLRHHASWYDLARDTLGMDLRSDEIIFVQGVVKTTDRWALTAVTDSGEGVEVHFSTDLGPYGNASFSFSRDRQASLSYPYRLGRALTTDTSRDEGASTGRKATKKDQCIFIHYYKLKRRWYGPKVIKAAAEPRDPSRGSGDEGHGPDLTAQYVSDMTEDIGIEQVPAPSMPYDPVGYVLDYILEKSEAETAIASDTDVISLFKDEEVITNIPELLNKIRPRVEVFENGLGMLSFETEPLVSENIQPVPQSTDGELIQPATMPSEAENSEPSTDNHHAITDEREHDDTSKKGSVILGRSAFMLDDDAGGVSTLVFSPNGQYVARGSEDSTIIIWDTVIGEKVSECLDHSDMICSLDFSPDSRSLVSGSRDTSAIIWSVDKGEPRQILDGHQDFVECVRYSPDGRTIATSSVDFTIRQWNAESGGAESILRGHHATVMLVAYSPNGRRLVSASADCTVRIWDTINDTTLAILEGHQGVIYSLAFSPDSRRLVTGSDDGSCGVWNVETGEELLTLHEHTGSVWTAMFSPHGKHLLSVASDRVVKVCDSFSGDNLSTVEVGNGRVSVAAFSPDGELVCTSAEDNAIRLYRTRTGACLALLQEHTEHVTHLKFSPDGDHIVSSDDNAVRLWHLSSLRVE
ncbi:hypothetical protein AcW1_002389 [Taiwanofungus camphoratus]|nr:hypothetical protein AcW1_002389 [Antrodia cinnamomea]